MDLEIFQEKEKNLFTGIRKLLKVMEKYYKIVYFKINGNCVG